MVAGFISGYLKSQNYEDALRLGAASGGATAFSSDLATREFIDKLVKEIKIEKNKIIYSLKKSKKKIIKKNNTNI